ncbi:MAG: hypothetical protein ABR538_13420 [Candidatus Binatia bacterium]
MHHAQALSPPAGLLQEVAARTSPLWSSMQVTVARDEELIKTAIDPATAADRIVAVVRSPKPALFNILDGKSRFFMLLNRFLRRRLRDAMLLGQMDIR